LDDFLQTKLFLRKNSRLELTTDSRACLGKLTNALDLIDEALMSLKEPVEVRERLMVGASASVASLWLMPRMSKFVVAAPEIDVTITTFIRRQEIENEGADLWICNWQTAIDRRVEPLMEEEIIPVCSPELATQFGNNSSDILQNVPLIHIDRKEADQNGPYPDWGRYLREYGVSRNDIAKGPRFNQASPSIEAAKIGLGALLGRSLLIEDDLKSGKLVQIGEAYPIRSPYFIVSPWVSSAPGTVNRFKDWLHEQVNGQIAVSHVVPV
jgi:LysR family transcriptional regulator, glycine cleavage system transcriptional activator